MLTTNYWGWIKDAAASDIQTSAVMLPSVKLLDGSAGDNYSIGGYTNYGPAKTGLTVVVGTDDTTPAADDLDLGADITASLSSYQITQTITLAPSGAGVDLTFTVSGENNTGATISIAEVGVVKEYATRGGTSCKTLFARFLLTDPIVVADGAGFSFAFKWSEA